jgi:hypothetical protein
MHWRDNGIRRFAWRPVKLEDGSWLLFEYYRSFLRSGNIPNILHRRDYLWVVRFSEKFNNIAESDAIVEKLSK